jgi:hypothetical protein
MLPKAYAALYGDFLPLFNIYTYFIVLYNPKKRFSQGRSISMSPPGPRKKHINHEKS